MKVSVLAGVEGSSVGKTPPTRLVGDGGLGQLEPEHPKAASCVTGNPARPAAGSYINPRYTLLTTLLVFSAVAGWITPTFPGLPGPSSITKKPDGPRAIVAGFGGIVTTIPASDWAHTPAESAAPGGVAEPPRVDCCKPEK